MLRRTFLNLLSRIAREHVPPNAQRLAALHEQVIPLMLERERLITGCAIIDWEDYRFESEQAGIINLYEWLLDTFEESQGSNEMMVLDLVQRELNHYLLFEVSWLEEEFPHWNRHMALYAFAHPPLQDIYLHWKMHWPQETWMSSAGC